MQRIVEARIHQRRVAKRRVFGDILDPLAVDPDFPAIPQACQVLLRGLKAPTIKREAITIHH
ncbi:hypothetical protein D3C79_1121980 [compost metagenome]